MYVLHSQRDLAISRGPYHQGSSGDSRGSGYVQKNVTNLLQTLGALVRETEELLTRMEVQRLTSLPVEVLSRILMHVDSSDILTVKLTCQTLCSITMTRQFWYNRIHRLCEEHAISTPEVELKEYTIAELEQWAMRRIRARSTSPVKLHLRSRDDPLVASYDDTQIIPGGRWLLKICDNSPVYFVDLDSSDLEEHLLLDPRSIDPRISHGETVGNYLWIDHKAPRLSFRLEGCLVVDKEGSLPSTWVYIYQVNFIGHGASAILEAQIIATFRRNTSTCSHAFNDHYFVSNSTAPTLEIFDYRQAMECFDYPLIEYHTHTHTSEYHPTEFEFINEDVLAVYYVAPSFYRIFNIESSTSLQFMHQIKVPEVWHFPSRTCWTPKATLFTLVGEHTKTLHGIVIPHERRFHPWTVELCTIIGDIGQPEYIELELGIFNSLLYNGKDKILRITHEWDYPCESPNINGTTRKSIVEQDVGHSHVCFTFEEDTGRFIHFAGGKLNVVDIVTAD